MTTVTTWTADAPAILHIGHLHVRFRLLMTRAVCDAFLFSFLGTLSCSSFLSLLPTENECIVAPAENEKESDMTLLHYLVKYLKDSHSTGILSMTPTGHQIALLNVFDKGLVISILTQHGSSYFGDPLKEFLDRLRGNATFCFPHSTPSYASPSLVIPDLLDSTPFVSSISKGLAMADYKRLNLLLPQFVEHVIFFKDRSALMQVTQMFQSCLKAASTGNDVHQQQQSLLELASILDQTLQRMSLGPST